MGRKLILGVGNPDRGDDGVGPEVVLRLRKRLHGQDVAFRTVYGDLSHLLDLWQGADLVVLVDAVLSGATPGTIHAFSFPPWSIGDIPKNLSSHSLDLRAVIQLAQVLGALPRKLFFYGVEGACFIHGARLSPEVFRAIDPLVERILKDLRGFKL